MSDYRLHNVTISARSGKTGNPLGAFASAVSKILNGVGRGVGQGTGVDPYLVFALRRPAYVYGIKLKYMVHRDKKTAPLRVSWKRSDRNEFSMAERNVFVNVETGKENTTIIPVNDTIDRYRIDLEDPTSAIRISEIELLLPPPALARRR